MAHVTLLLTVNILYFYISTFCSRCTVPSMAPLCGFYMLSFLSMLLRYCLNDSEMVSFAAFKTIITLVTVHMRCFSFVWFYVKEHSRLLS
jgi:hypothetical protein